MGPLAIDFTLNEFKMKHEKRILHFTTGEKRDNFDLRTCLSLGEYLFVHILLSLSLFGSSFFKTLLRLVSRARLVCMRSRQEFKPSDFWHGRDHHTAMIGRTEVEVALLLLVLFFSRITRPKKCLRTLKTMFFTIVRLASALLNFHSEKRQRSRSVVRISLLARWCIAIGDRILNRDAAPSGCLRSKETQCMAPSSATFTIFYPVEEEPSVPGF